jgi:hypothetical protein
LARDQALGDEPPGMGSTRGQCDPSIDQRARKGSVEPRDCLAQGTRLDTR